MGKKKKKKHIGDPYEIAFGTDWAYIAGFTSGGAPYGITQEEADALEADQDIMCQHNYCFCCHHMLANDHFSERGYEEGVCKECEINPKCDVAAECLDCRLPF